MGGKGRIALGALLLAYVPVFGYVVIVTTPAYAALPWVSIFVAPAALASLALALLLSSRAVRPAAWAVIVILGAGLIENIVSIVNRTAGWQARLGSEISYLAALQESGANAWYWLPVIAPLAVALVLATVPRP